MPRTRSPAPTEPTSLSPESDIALDVRGVSKRFAGVVALDDVSLALAPGEVHALVGENGAGKSTLIKVINGVYAADAGEVRLAGAAVAFASPREAQEHGVSTIFQEINLVPLMTVAQNVFLGREPRGRLGLLDRRRMEREARAPARLRRAGRPEPAAALPRGRHPADGRHRAGGLARRPCGHHGRADLLAGAARGGRPLRGDPSPARRRRRGRLRLPQARRAVRDLRAGHDPARRAPHPHGGALAALDRAQLVAHMLGREVAEVERHGVTSFGADRQEGTEAPVLQATGLTREPVLHDVSLAVRPGEVVGLGGLLGAGRSETARAIVGADHLDDGEVRVGGRRVRGGSPIAAARAGIAMIPEDRKADGVIPQLSVRENITLAALGRLSRGGLISDRAEDQLVEAFMRRLRIKASSPDQRVLELSGGNQQKVLLARCLCMSPTVLILDEPTRGIDVGAKGEIQALVDELAEQGLAVVLISSELEEVVEGADEVVVLREGAVVDILRGEDVTIERLVGALSRG